MNYRYKGRLPQELCAAYETDAEPFPTQAVTFPDRPPCIPEIGLLRQLLFPRSWNAGELVDDPSAVRDYLNELGQLLCQGIEPYAASCLEEVVTPTLDQLPAIRASVKTDVEAAYKGDPAAKSYTEVIRAYPGLRATMVQRFAHQLYEAEQPVYARELTEAAKSETGIDIHPGANIGDYCFIDHGTGVVIGETATIGEWVRIYQNVTLGALHFEQDENDAHALAKGYKRHPDVGDNVVIGAGSKLLGPIDIGDHVSVGANTWITDDLPPHTTVYIDGQPAQKRRYMTEQTD